MSKLVLLVLMLLVLVVALILGSLTYLTYRHPRLATPLLVAAGFAAALGGAVAAVAAL
ncbi:hypothetical protein [Streptomyces flavidovirens]|uniref:Uncharacterized protein n=1 Tax=Streptomyces flavidovirens TaxID=67298 RepID=A0ABW6RRW1_9ACTN